MSGLATVNTVADPSSDPAHDPEQDSAVDPKPDPASGEVAEPVSDADVRDELPDDLDISEFVGPYIFPNNNRRRVPGYLYIAIGILCAVIWAIAGDDAVLVNEGVLIGGIALIVIGLYHLVAGWNLDVDERDALVAATERVAFPVGHASAQLGWRGLRSRPTWRLLLYSAENPPLKRGLVFVDGVDGEIIDWFTEDNPEDWSDLDGDLTH